MKKLMTATALAIASMSAAAQDPFTASGQNLTMGQSSNRNSVISAINNPAAAGNFVGAGQREYRFGLMSSTGMGLEIGKVDDFYDEMENLVDQLDQDDITATEAIDLAEDFNELLPIVGEEGYVNIGGGTHLPGFPVVINHGGIGGALTLDMTVSTESHVRLLDDEVAINPISDEVETNSAAYIKGSVTQEFSLGYSRAVWKHPQGTLFAGVRGKVMRMGLNKSIIPVEEMMDDNSDVGDYLSNDFVDDTLYSSAVSLDSGLLWSSKYYQVGATAINLTSPEFEYPALGENCAALTGFEQDRCFTSQSFANEIDLAETYTMDPQLKLESAVFTANRKYQVALALDATSVRDPVAQERQWLNLSVGATPWWGINVRGGYRANLAGNQLKAVTVGTSLFRAFNFDLAYGLDSVEVDGTTVPRSFAANMGLELVF
jgi:hypothetical protein